MNTSGKRISSKAWVSIALVLCLISSIGASVIQSSFGSVRVEDFKVIVDDGYYINGQIYIPKTASPDNKLPLIVLSHGSFNNLEMQDLNMIELSRRGFVVISSDAYRHGSSSIVKDASKNYANMIHLIDYATSSYTFIDTDKVGVSGHSMGGMISNETVKHFLKQEALGLGDNKVAAILDVGADAQYVPYEFEGVSHPVLPTVSWGMVAGKYDEWFFKGETGNPALFLKSEAAKSFVNQLEGVHLTGDVENAKVYKGTINGENYIRAIYQNTEIHPANHFSTASAASVVDFFYSSLGTPSGHTAIAATNQIWMWKELFNLVGLVGIFLFLFPFSCVVMKSIPYFTDLQTTVPVSIAPALDSSSRKLSYSLCYAINLVLPALLVMPIMFRLVGKESFVPITATAWFGEPNTNELAAWTLVVSICILAVFLIFHKLFGNAQSFSVPEYWGIKSSWKSIWKSFVLALMTVGAAYIVLFFSDLVFNTDYRIWMIAMRVFTVDKLIFAIAYFPAFVLFYLVNSMLVNGGNRVEGMSDWLVTLISCVSNVAGIGALIFIQYAGIIGSGTFAFNSMRIVNLFPLLVLIPVATIITRYFFKATGKVYLGSFIIAMLYTMMTVSNTMILSSVIK